MEEELVRCQSGQIGVLDKPSAGRTVVILDEVRERSVFEAKGDTFTTDVLRRQDGLCEEEKVR